MQQVAVHEEGFEDAERVAIVMWLGFRTAASSEYVQAGGGSQGTIEG